MGANNDFNRFVLPDNLTQDWLIAGSQAIGYGDLMYYNAGDICKPADQLATLGTEALDQAQFAALFIGVSQQQVLVSETSTTKRIPLRTDGVMEFKCPSNTFNKGDLVGIFSNGTNLDPQQVDKVTVPALAIGIVVKYYTAATTRVRVRLISRYTDALTDSLQFPGFGALQGGGVTTLTDANQVLTVASTPILNMVPTAARTVNLPKEAQSNKLGLVFYFTNNSAGAFSVTFQSSAGGGIKGNGVVPQNKTGYFWCDGTNWNGMVSA